MTGADDESSTRASDAKTRKHTEHGFVCSGREAPRVENGRGALREAAGAGAGQSGLWRQILRGAAQLWDRGAASRRRAIALCSYRYVILDDVWSALVNSRNIIYKLYYCSNNTKPDKICYCKYDNETVRLGMQNAGGHAGGVSF